MTVEQKAAWSVAAKREDKWAFVKIGEPFPENPVRVKGETNQYIALWYKNGKPVFGRAWMNGGVLECSFPFNKKELKGAKDLGGEIQVLVHQGDFDANGYWYDWVQFPQRRQDHLKLVYCGQAAPIYTKNTKDEGLVGNITLNNEVASVSYDGRADDFEGAKIADMLVPVRNFKNPMGDAAPPPEKKEEGLGQLIVELGGMFGQDLWCDVRVGDLWPSHTVAGWGRPLKVDADGTKQESCAALWYQHGIPVMGRCWKTKEGKIEVSFGWHGHEYTNAGSFQILRHHNAKSHGFEYQWMSYTDLKANKDGWEKVHVSNIAPCINITNDGREMLGKIDMFKEVASFGHEGKEHITDGPKVAPFIILSRRTVDTK
jgi:hypothetical protein